MRGQDKGTIAERIRARFDALTRAERQLVNALLANYPVAGLSSITELARTANVSTPTVLRTAKKLGFSGFPDFQATLRKELAAQLSTPIVKHDRWASGAPAAHILNQFAAAVTDNLRTSLRHLDHREFDRIVQLLADQQRGIHILGGRITRSLASYLLIHLDMVRSGVSLLPASENLWPQYALSMVQSDVLVVFDVRRYELSLHEFAELAKARGLSIVLFTDQWMSPISSIARHALPLRIEVPSSWDSGVVTLFVIEALIAAVVNMSWPDAAGRMQELEALFDRTKRFKKL